LWHVPQLDLALYGIISLLDNKVNIRSDIFIRDGVEAQSTNGNEVALDDLFDLNLEATLTPVENVGIYVSGKNILDRTYRRWYGYPNVGIHLEGGIKLKF
jgi:outer membrane receptor protein involved in Fe transport